jgi:hypothetical protein
MGRRILSLVVFVAVAVVAIVWWQRPPALARRFAAEAVTAEQGRLWEQAAQRGTPGLERLPIPARPLERRERAGAAAQAVPSGTPTLPPGVVSVARVVATSETGPWEFSGKATVLDVNGDRVNVSLDGGRTLSFLARLAGQPLGVVAQQVVDLTFKSRPGVFDRRQILAIRTASGQFIASVVENGNAPVSVSLALPSLTFTASQTGQPFNGAMNVVVVVNGDKGDVSPGRSAQIGGLSINLLGSLARAAGGAAGDSGAYSIDLIAWQNP